MKKKIYYVTICLLIVSLPTSCKYNPFLAKHPKKVSSIKIKPQNPHPNKFLKEMNEEELNDMLQYAKAISHQELAFKIFHFLMSISSKQDSLKTYKLDLADYCFKLKEYEKSAFSYEEFIMLYPGSEEFEYAQYKLILTWFYMSLDPDRDQTNTHKTISLVNEFIKKAKETKYIDEALDIKTQCQQKLFEHEVHVFENYIKQRQFIAAQKRLNYITENFNDIKNIDLYKAYLEKMLNICKDPKKRPFYINFNIEDALIKQKTASPANKKKTTMFFLA